MHVKPTPDVNNIEPLDPTPRTCTLCGGTGEEIIGEDGFGLISAGECRACDGTGMARIGSSNP